MEGLYCVRCHSRIPHGTNRPRLFAYGYDPAPYNYADYSVMQLLEAATENGAYARQSETTVSVNENAKNDKKCNKTHDSYTP